MIGMNIIKPHVLGFHWGIAMSPVKKCPAGTHASKSAGGDYIYLWATEDPGCAAITDIIVLEGKNARAPEGYTKINKDLNDGAGGAYLYFAYKREPIQN